MLNQLPNYFSVLLYSFLGGESLDFLQLFCTCIRTEQVRKTLIIFLILNEFHVVKWKNLELIHSDGISQCFYATQVFFYTSSSKDSHTLLEFEWKNTMCLKRTHIQ